MKIMTVSIDTRDRLLQVQTIMLHPLEDWVLMIWSIVTTAHTIIMNWDLGSEQKLDNPLPAYRMRWYGRIGTERRTGKQGCQSQRKRRFQRKINFILVSNRDLWNIRTFYTYYWKQYCIYYIFLFTTLY